MNGVRVLRFRDGVAGSPANAIMLLKSAVRNGGRTSPALIATLRMRALQSRTVDELLRGKTSSLNRLFAEAMDGITNSNELLEKLKTEAIGGKATVARLIEQALSSSINERLQGLRGLSASENFKALYYVFVKTDCKFTSIPNQPSGAY